MDASTLDKPSTFKFFISLIICKSLSLNTGTISEYKLIILLLITLDFNTEF